MAKQITELTTAGAVTAGSDLLWLEQAGLPRKITVTALSDALPGTVSSGTVTEATLRWDGAAWVENTSFRTNTQHAGVYSTAPQYYFVESGVTAENTRWSWTVDGEAFTGRLWNDANSAQVAWMTVQRTANVCDSVVFNSTIMRYDSATFGGFTVDRTTATGSSSIRYQNDDAVKGYLGFNHGEDLVLWNTAIAVKMTVSNTGLMSFPAAPTGSDIISFSSTTAKSGIEKITDQGGLMMHCDSTMILFAGDNFAAFQATDMGVVAGTTTEDLILGSDGRVRLYSNRQTSQALSYQAELGTDGHWKVYNQTQAFTIDMYHDGTNGIINSTSGALLLQSVSNNVYAGGVNATQPWLVLDSTSTGDNWTAQGAGISVGEGGKKGAACVHITYNGDGSGYIGMGNVTDTAGTGGRTDAGHFDFTYNNNQIKVGGRLYPGVAGTAATTQGTAYIEDASGQNYGSINVAGVTGTSGTYAGYGINARATFMNNGSTITGIYNDWNNQWFIRGTENSTLDLYFAGVVEAQTANSDNAGATSGLKATDHNQQLRFVGYQDAVVKSFIADMTLDEMDVGNMLYKDVSTASLDIILPSSTTAFPLGSIAHFINAGNSAVTINASSQTRTLYWQDGATRTGGASTNRTVAYGGVISIWRHSATIYYIWGSGIS